MLMSKSVLIIDDEADICFLLSNILKERNIKASYANTLGDGINKIISLKPHILFLDINLPDGSGLDAIVKIKELAPEIKIIIISAYDSSKERAAAFEQGANMFLSKPLNKNLIYSAFEQILDAP